MTSMDISRTYNYARPSGTWRILCSFNTCVNSSFTASRLAAQRVAPSEPVDALNESLMLVVIFSICLVVYHALMCRRNVRSAVTLQKHKYIYHLPQNETNADNNDEWRLSECGDGMYLCTGLHLWCILLLPFIDQKQQPLLNLLDWHEHSAVACIACVQGCGRMMWPGLWYGLHFLLSAVTSIICMHGYERIWLELWYWVDLVHFALDTVGVQAFGGSDWGCELISCNLRRQ